MSFGHLIQTMVAGSLILHAIYVILTVKDTVIHLAVIRHLS